MIRVKIKCREPSKIPKKRVMEMGDDIYILKFKTEDVGQETETKEGGDGKGGKGEGEENLDEDDLLDDELGKIDKDQIPPNDDTPIGGSRLRGIRVFKALARIVRRMREAAKWLRISSPIWRMILRLEVKCLG